MKPSVSFSEAETKMRIIQESNEEVSQYIRERLIAYNAEQLPEEVKSKKGNRCVYSSR